MTTESEQNRIQIHTDGACLGNPGPGGWAAILIHPKKTTKISGGYSLTTNNRMEMMAAIEALRSLRFPCLVTLYTDSEYLKKGLTEWLAKWKRNGWKTAGKSTVKNKDLWQELDRLLNIHHVNFQWVKGHAGHAHNEECDRLAGQAARKNDLPPDPGYGR